MKDHRKIVAYIAGALLFFLPMPALSQIWDEVVTPAKYRTTLLGVGGAQVYDTYLSPLNYKGFDLSLLHERRKEKAFKSDHLMSQHLWYLELSRTLNPSRSAADYTALLNYDYGLHYHIRVPIRGLDFYGGGQLGGMFGCIYNSRNGNNPASVKANANLSLSCMASYRFKVDERNYALRYQADIPTIGVFFSPEYGQSYYEIGLGVRNNLAHFASFHNQMAIRNTLTFEIFFTDWALRLSYMNRIYETRINSLDTRLMSNTFMVGASWYFPMRVNVKQVYP